MADSCQDSLVENGVEERTALERSGSYIKSHLPHNISPRFWNMPELEGESLGVKEGVSTWRRVLREVLRSD